MLKYGAAPRTGVSGSSAQRRLGHEYTSARGRSTSTSAAAAKSDPYESVIGTVRNVGYRFVTPVEESSRTVSG